MQAMKRVIVAAVAVAMVNGCASGGGGGGGSTATATYADGSTRELTLQEFLGCVLTAGLLCPRSASQSTTAASSSGGATTTTGASASSASGSSLTSSASGAQPVETWEQRRDAMFEVAAVESRLNYYADVSPDRPVIPVSAAGSGPFATVQVTTSDSEIVSLETQGQVLTVDGTTLPTQRGIANASSEAPTTVGLIANPYRLGWSYQSFGAWNQHSSAEAGIGASSFGQATPATSIPTSGTAHFGGTLAGFYVSAGGARTTAAAAVNVAVDFGARSLSFASSGTEITGSGNTPVPLPHLDLHGSMTYSANSASFSGSFANAGGNMQGGTQGRFYGPAAQELGGVFMVRDTGTSESLVGAYGAKR